ncbi:hypothetical protein BTURTLESOX_815 [bacterium endosymbiont of Bathymodiolus sp. 5 South]|nr:hypothetical protein [uncultured Gammaproteobacteria bacterium]SHN93919.1 hypothetical protein BCLUESOX_1224 [bacterium endosymbiont of Bathymodiolus sp. 5 South]CAC9645836.1 hypothetical protein [uncultured Gammaproteobacteria bacterium]SSC08526.1 hypothetical protein BTURTLESOX_815 [bacterium endosymbiont of Bathymodiolus sp. 5 South]VVH55954.1 hypothetical protein BSPCLSOX_1502 [uncultured Gammaproteobacteria bacterium]
MTFCGNSVRPLHKNVYDSKELEELLDISSQPLKTTQQIDL